jgi:predicted acetyltransferase
VTSPIRLRLCDRQDKAWLRGWMRAHLEVLATWNPTVDVEAPFDEQWFEKPGVLFPWAIEFEGEAAGFALLGNHRLAEAMGASGDFYLHEFHIGAAFRRRGVGHRAMDLLMEQHPGNWTVDVLPANGPAVAFWERVFLARGGRRSTWTSDDGVVFARFSADG